MCVCFYLMKYATSLLTLLAGGIFVIEAPANFTTANFTAGCLPALRIP